MGFLGALVYTTSTCLHDIISRPSVQHHVDNGFLNVVRFDYLPDALAQPQRHFKVLRADF